MTTEKTNRRALLTGGAAIAAAVGVSAGVSKAAETPVKKVYRTGPKPPTPPAFRPAFRSAICCFFPASSAKRRATSKPIRNSRWAK